jgi:hypothetical protein
MQSLQRCTADDPYPSTVWDETMSFEYPEHWATDDATGPACLCESGWLPLPDGGAIECHVCGVSDEVG